MNKQLVKYQNNTGSQLVSTGQMVQDSIRKIADNFSAADLQSTEALVIMNSLIKVVDMNNSAEFLAKYDDMIVAFIANPDIPREDKNFIMSLQVATKSVSMALAATAREQETMIKIAEYRTKISTNEASISKEIRFLETVKNNYSIASTIGVVGLSAGTAAVAHKSILQITGIFELLTSAISGAGKWIENPGNFCTITEKVKREAIKCGKWDLLCKDIPERIEEEQRRSGGMLCGVLEAAGKGASSVSKVADESRTGTALLLSLIIFIMMFFALFLLSKKIKIPTLFGYISINGADESRRVTRSESDVDQMRLNFRRKKASRRASRKKASRRASRKKASRRASRRASRKKASRRASRKKASSKKASRKKASRRASRRTSRKKASRKKALRSVSRRRRI
jgi:hypothetical protein